MADPVTIPTPSPRMRQQMGGWTWEQARARFEMGTLSTDHWRWYDREWRRTHGDPTRKGARKLDRRQAREDEEAPQ